MHMKKAPLTVAVSFRTTKEQKERIKALCTRFRGTGLSQADIVRAGLEYVLGQKDPDAVVRHYHTSAFKKTL